MSKTIEDQGNIVWTQLIFPENLFSKMTLFSLLDIFLHQVQKIPPHKWFLKNLLMEWELKHDLGERCSQCVGHRLEVKRCHDLFFELIDLPNWIFEINRCLALWPAALDLGMTHLDYLTQSMRLYHVYCFDHTFPNQGQEI